MFVRSHQAYGDVVRLHFGAQDYYLLHDPSDVHHVLVDRNKSYVKSKNYRGLKIVVGDGLLTTEGDVWRKKRKLSQPAFHRQHLARFAQMMATDTRSMLDRWATLGGGAIDVHAEMMRLTFRVVGRTLFNTDVDSDARAVGDALKEALTWMDAYVESLFHLPPWVPTPDNLRFARAMRTLDALVHRIIDERRVRPGDGADLLGMLMSVKDEDTGEGMTNHQLRDEVMTLVLAGHETTANALSWTFYLLSQHPDAARALQAEVAAVLGGRDPELGDLSKLTYTKMVIEEALRLYPPAWVFEREALEDDEIGGYLIQKGAIVGVSPWSIHRSPKLWEDPERFDPLRFLPERVAARHKFAYLPFGGGPRLCIGNAFAMMEAQIIVAMVAQRHALGLVAGHPVVPEPLVTLRPRHGMRMRLEPLRAEPPVLRVA
jgi:cytochrome P450